MIGPFDTLPEKKKLLIKYKNYFNKLSIGSISTTSVWREHFQAIHVYLRVLTYYDLLDKDKIDVDSILVEDVYYELLKSLYLLDTKYYA